MPRTSDRRHAPDCTIEVDGRPVPARAGESVAAALIAAGHVVMARSSKYHRPRGPFCLAGSCHACIARIAGVPNQRTCRVPCRPGLVVETQNAFPSAEHDVLVAIDRAYPQGLDHHHLMTWNATANRAAVAVSRRLAGTGRLADRAASPSTTPVEERFDALIVGGGPAGLGATEALVSRGAHALLVEADPIPGGRLRCALPVAGVPPSSWAIDVARRVTAAGSEVALGWSACGVWRDGGARVVLLEREGEPPSVRLIRPGILIFATGSWATPPLVPRNDLPGLYAGRGVARMLAEEGVLPGRRCAVAGDDGEERDAIARVLRAAGAEVATTPGLERVAGRRRVSAIVTADGRRLGCDALVWCGRRAPASDLARQTGAAVDLDAGGGWRVRAAAGGATSVPGVLAAGEVVARMGAAEAVEAGRRAGEAAGGD